MDRLLRYILTLSGKLCDRLIAETVEYKNYTRGQCKQWYFEDNICSDNNFAPFISRGQYLSLNVTNNAIAHTVQCAFTPTYGNYNLPTPLRCTGGDFDQITLDVTWTGAAPTAATRST